jgi:hypothetical protein
MPRLTTVQAAHTYGVLDPHAIERRDTKFIGSSLSDGNNIVLLPQGGYTDRGGSTDVIRARRALTPVTVTSGMISLPNGGTAADLLDPDDTITTSAASTTRFVVAEVDFGAATNVLFIDAGGVSIATTAASNALIAEYWTGSSWAAFGSPVKITLAALSRRFAAGAPGHAGVTANKFRLCVDATTAAGAVTLTTLKFFRESATLSDGIVRPYAPEQGMAHDYLVTDRNIDVFEAGVWRAAIAFPGTEAMIRTIKFEAKYNTILAFHNDLHPQQILRLDASTEWACDKAPFVNIPRADYGGVYTNGVVEVQEIQLYGIALGEQFDLLLEGQTTTAITRHASDVTITAADIKAALEDLSNVGTGLTVTHISGTIWRVEFTGADNKDRDWLQMVGTALDNTSGYVRIRTLTQGKTAGEDLISDARGWPAFGRFAQQRLVMGGLKSRPKDILASVTGTAFDLNTELGVATGAISYEVDGTENTALRDLVVSAKLIFFGDKQIVYLKNNTLSATEVPQFGTSDAPGIKQSVATVSSDNALFYIQDRGMTLRQMNYTELEQNYVADNASVLSAFLIRDPVDITRRRATSGVDSDLIVMANANGTMTALTMMRTQEVSGFAPWATDGLVRSICTDDDNTTWWLVQRQTNGVATLRLEKQEPDKLLDEALEFDYGNDPQSVITGLSAFNGRVVWAVASNRVFGPYTVSGGQIDLGSGNAASLVRVGTWIAPSATDPAVSLEEETRARQARLKRVNRARISVLDTTSIAIRANDGPVVDLPLRTNQDTILDEGILARPFTGHAEAEGMHGFTDHGRLTVTQLFPGTLTVRSVTKNIAA